ncbi:hypothetical protein AQPE_0311 [Aquipluma nitroreducens]|uniref:Carbohydrate-binding domain-containing protein n=1 Tax=Aquipluma nitroreducens TaxID=2010828 RepID=A0A5K7S496_9BACT|nr:carbohydrate-binding family 9-like protein [Aquipluma nitroreducens]BBE16174.1 hypothetical protein AQPE_0311 [Aquipluma nitroreducens]
MKNGKSSYSESPYTCYRAPSPITIDGDLTKPVWQKARKSPRFVDMINGYPGYFDTRAAVLWDDEALYIAFWVEEPFVEAKLTQRDDIIFQENDVEVFIDGGDCYYEFEINALNTVYEVFFIWQDAFKKFDAKEFDVHSRDAFTFGGNHDRDAPTFWRGNHPRGLRWAYTDWDIAGLRSAVQVQGTINDNTDIDKGWTVEIAFPWSGMKHLAKDRNLPPQQDDIWKIFFGRFGKHLNGNGVIQNAMSWDKIGDNDNHKPELYTPILFSNKNTPGV